MNAIRETVGQDVRSANITGTGTAVAGPARLKHIWFRRNGVGNARLELRDGGAGGTLKLVLDGITPVGVQQLPLAEGGMVFATDVHAALTNINSLTLIYR